LPVYISLALNYFQNKIPFSENYRKGAIFKKSACRGTILQKRLKTTGLKSNILASPNFLAPQKILGWLRHWLPVGKVTCACFRSSLKSSLIGLAWEQCKLAQVFNSNVIFE